MKNEIRFLIFQIMFHEISRFIRPMIATIINYYDRFKNSLSIFTAYLKSNISKNR